MCKSASLLIIRADLRHPRFFTVLSRVELDRKIRGRKIATFDPEIS